MILFWQPAKRNRVREFIMAVFSRMGVELSWQGEGVGEKGVVKSVSSKLDEIVQFNKDGDIGHLVPGSVIIEIDPRYFRPTEVELLIGNAEKAKRELGWAPKTSFQELVAEMVATDLEEAKRDLHLMNGGFNVLNCNE